MGVREKIADQIENNLIRFAQTNGIRTKTRFQTDSV